MIQTNKHPKIVLVGQPNCGKSTIFNKVAGYRSISTNFPGATVEFLQSHVNVLGSTCDLVDLPGIYSLISLDTATEETKKYLLNQDIDVIINVIDASILSRSLELTLQLVELDRKMVLCLNMMDEAERKGVIINIPQLHRELNVPAIPTVGSKGHGINQLFKAASDVISSQSIPQPVKMSKHVEDTIDQVETCLQKHPVQSNYNNRLISIKLLENDPFFQRLIQNKNSGIMKTVESVQNQLEAAHGEPADAVISAERHSQAMAIFEKTATVQHAKKSWKESIDSLLMHNVLGYVFMFAILFGFFNIIFTIGAGLEEPILNVAMNSIQHLSEWFGQDNFLYVSLRGIIEGIASGIAIVLPYLLPFLVGLALLEDIGYLPRIAFLMDNFMHKIGLHGTAVIPGILGYGCSVPAIMSTRILSSPRDRFISAVVSILIPCSARMTVIFGLVGYYLGGTAALSIYLLNIVVISITGTILSRLLPEEVPGMILEIPSYQLPDFKVILSKTWLRMRDFIVVAWPLLIVGSLVLSLAQWFSIDEMINAILSPLTHLLGLPEVVGTTLIFGILRKELSMLMLIQALGTTDIHSVMSSGQLLVFTVFIVFYVPCIATIGVLKRELGLKKTVLATLITVIIALVVAFLTRIFAMIIY